MGTLKADTKYIYESPDKGKTVYAREIGSDEKRLVGYNIDKKDYKNLQGNLDLWQDIILESEKNDDLKRALDAVILTYELIKAKRDPLYVRL